MDTRLREAWQKGIDYAGLTPYSQALHREACPCYWIDTPRRDRYRETGNTRLGGDPDLPRGVAWPVTEAGYMTFLAQIDLAQLWPGHVPDLPGRGRLYFFLGVVRAEYDLPHRVLYDDRPALELTRTRPPQGVPPVDRSRRFAPRQIMFYPQFTLSPESPLWEEIGVENPPDYLITTGSTQLGGHAVTWAGEPAENAYLARSGFGPLVGMAVESLSGLDRTEERLRRDMARAQQAGQDTRQVEGSLAALQRYRADFDLHREGAAGWRTLLILASDEQMGMSWGDNGVLQFLIHEQDLRARCFDRTYCELTTS